MTINQKSLFSTAIFGFSMLATTLAWADSTPPTCPSANSYPIVFASKNNLSYGSIWGAISNTIGGDWDNVFVGMNDTDLLPNPTSDQLKNRANDIEKTQGVVVEQKIFKNSGHSGPYFWACSYGIGNQYVNYGDSMSVFSPTYDKDGSLAATQLSNAEKLQLLKSQH